MTTAQDLRQKLHDLVRETLPAPLWGVTMKSKPDNARTCLAQIGHVAFINADAYAQGAIAASMTVTLWVNEGNNGQGATLLYDQLARTDGSLLEVLWNTRGIQVEQIGNVGLRDDGPTDFLAGDIAVVMHGRA